MNAIALPIDIAVPVYWTRSRMALIYKSDGSRLGTIKRVVKYTRRFMGIPLSHIETLALYMDYNPTLACTIRIRAGFPLEFKGSDEKPLGNIDQKSFSVIPEFDCTDECGKLIGTIKPAGINKMDITFNGFTCCSQFSKSKSKGLKPRQYVWELSADNSNRLDIRLILGFIALGQMPDTSTSTG